MMMRTFDHLFLMGRPAAGKSEFIDFMQKTPDDERANVFHIGKFQILDDFHWLWEKFLEDDLWEEAGYPRQFSDKSGGNYSVRTDRAGLYDLMFAKFNNEIKEKYLKNSDFYTDHTLFVEFARGGDRGYQNAFSRLSKEVLERTAILYVHVEFEESWRRNVARYEEKLKHSSLAHMAPREVMERFYKTEDWGKITGGKESGMLAFQGAKIPFVTMNNTPELKERAPLADRYRLHLDRLIELYSNR